MSIKAATSSRERGLITGMPRIILLEEPDFVTVFNSGRVEVLVNRHLSRVVISASRRMIPEIETRLLRGLSSLSSDSRLDVSLTMIAAALSDLPSSVRFVEIEPIPEAGVPSCSDGSASDDVDWSVLFDTLNDRSAYAGDNE